MILSRGKASPQLNGEKLGIVMSPETKQTYFVHFCTKMRRNQSAVT